MDFSSLFYAIESFQSFTCLWPVQNQLEEDSHSLISCSFFFILVLETSSKMKMQLFQLVRNKYALMGIQSDQSNQKSRLNAKNVIFLGILTISVMLSFAYLFLDARAFEDYINCVQLTSGFVSGWLSFITIIWKTKELSKFIGNLEKIVDEREFKLHFYCEFISSY